MLIHNIGKKIYNLVGNMLLVLVLEVDYGPDGIGTTY